MAILTLSYGDNIFCCFHIGCLTSTAKPDYKLVQKPTQKKPQEKAASKSQ